MIASAPSEGSRAIPARVAPALMRWFRSTRRPLPWRRDRDPYRIWVAEVLLQQTRVAAAVPYFERFVRRFPDLSALARARPDAVLKVWEGAGYYARARNLHVAAKELVARGSRQPPRSVEELELLPGIGPYIARAVASIAFGAPVVALEANGVRVVARLLRDERETASPTSRERFTRALAEQLPKREAGEFNEAVMELGETVCLPRRPRCPECPISFGCRAYAELTDPGTLPRRIRPPRRPPHRRVAIVVLADGGRWLVQRRPPGGLLGGLWEFPGGRIEDGERPQDAARRELREETGFSVRNLSAGGIVRHRYSHFSVELHVFRGRPAGTRPRLPPGRRWVTPQQLARLPTPRATQKVVRGLVRMSDRPGPAPEEPCGRAGGGPGPHVAARFAARSPRRSRT